MSAGYLSDGLIAQLAGPHSKVDSDQVSGKRLLLVTMDELLSLKDSDQFATLLVKRLLGLAASGTFQLDPI